MNVVRILLSVCAAVGFSIFWIKVVAGWIGFLEMEALVLGLNFLGWAFGVVLLSGVLVPRKARREFVLVISWILIGIATWFVLGLYADSGPRDDRFMVAVISISVIVGVYFARLIFDRSGLLERRI